MLLFRFVFFENFLQKKKKTSTFGSTFIVPCTDRLWEIARPVTDIFWFVFTPVYTAITEDLEAIVELVSVWFCENVYNICKAAVDEDDWDFDYDFD